MPDWMKLTRDGLKRIDYDPKIRNYVENPVDSWVPYLRYECHLDEDFTVRHLCDYVSNDQELKKFVSQYSQCRDIEKFHHELNFPIPCEEFDAVEVFWYAFIEDNGLGQTLECVARAHGIKDDHRYGLDFRSLGEIAHLPLKLNTEFKVYGDAGDVLLTATKEFSLLNIMDSFYWEISFYGSPEDRDQVAQEGKDLEDELYFDEQDQLESVPVQSD